MALETLKGVTKIGGFDVVVMDELREKFPDKLTIEIDFSKITVQPHIDFEDMFCHVVAEHLGEEINGLMENHS